MRSLRTTVGLTLLALAVTQLAIVVFVRAAANSVPVTMAVEDTAAMDGNALSPLECASLNLNGGVVYGDGDLAGGPGSQLILGGATDQTIEGGPGNDCIVGGSGTDTLDGEQGNDDICIGSATSTFVACETTYVE